MCTYNCFEVKYELSFHFKDNGEEHGNSKLTRSVPLAGECDQPHPHPAVCSMPIYSSTMAGDVWGQWFACCITQQPPQVILNPYQSGSGVSLNLGLSSCNITLVSLQNA